MDSQLKVCFVTTSDLTGQSGNNIATNEMVRAFGRHQDIRLSLICPQPQAELPKEIAETTDSLSYIRPQTTGSIAEHFLTQVSLFPAMYTAARRWSPDVFVIRHSPTMIVPPLSAKLAGIPYVLLARGLSHEQLRFSRLLRLVFRISVRNASQVICAYTAVKERIDDIRPSDRSEAVVFSNAVNPEELSPIARQSARTMIEPEYTADEFVIGFVGSLKEWHELERLIQAVEHLPEEVKLLIVGDGPMREQLQSQVEHSELGHRVHFTGFVDHQRVNEYISASDLLYGVVDPEHPGNAIKCYEYLSCARPIITDARPEFTFVDEHEFGVVLESVTVDAIVDGIERIRSRSPAERADMGTRGRAYITENHTWEQLPELVHTEYRTG